MFCGLDLSTQSLKSIFVQDDKIIFKKTVNFSEITEDFIIQKNLQFTQDIRIFLNALDLLFSQIQTQIDLKQVKAISFSAQQHGSVYWKNNAINTLKNLKPQSSLFEQLQNQFATNNCPIWMDSSTKNYCENLEKQFGKDHLQEITGSVAFERFTGNQIAKIYNEDIQIYNNCERISLISSFLGCIFTSKYVDIDYSDACGMNLFCIKTMKWHPQLITLTANEDLVEKLGKNCHPSYSSLGEISDYFKNKYNFQECLVISPSGDNPNSFGLLGQNDSIIISLGTSDTLITGLNDMNCNKGSVFISPVDQNKKFVMLVYKNAGLFRQKIMENTIKEWKNLQNIQINENYLGHYQEMTEIIEQTKIGNFVYQNSKLLEKQNLDENDLLTMIENRFFQMKQHISELSIQFKKIIVTGGAANNIYFLQIISDILNCEVFTCENQDSACLGAALRAKHGYQVQQSWNEFQVNEKIIELKKQAIPINNIVYQNKFKKYQQFIKLI